MESGGGGGAGVDFGAPPVGEAGAFSSHQHQHQHQRPRSQRQFSADSRGADGGMGGAGEYPYSSAAFDGGREVGDSSGRVGGNNAEGGSGVSSHRVAHASRQDGVDGGNRGGAAAAARVAAATAAAAVASASFPRRYDYVEYSAPMDFRAGGAVSSSMVDDRGGGGGGHRRSLVPPQQQQQQAQAQAQQAQRDLRTSTGLLPRDMLRSQPNTPHGGEGGGAWDSGGGAGGAVPPMTAAERAGHEAVRSSGGGGGELEYSDGYTAHRSSSTSSGHHVTRHNAVSNKQAG